MTEPKEWIDQIICGDVIETLKKMASSSVNCIMFSPPYFQQRDYKVEGQIGLEKTYQGWLEKMWAVMGELWRVLRPDGTVWVNLGDKYGGNNSRASFGGRAGFGTPREGVFRSPGDKSLLFLPERFAIGCLERGWCIPNKNIWQKPNPMPSSGKGRFTNTWEYLYFMVKNTKPIFFVNTVTRKTLERKPPKHKLQINRDWKWKDDQKRKKVTLWRSGDYFFDLDAVRKRKMDSTIQREKYSYVDKTGTWGLGLRECGVEKSKTAESFPAGKNPGDVITTKILKEDAEKMASPRARQWRQGERESVKFFNPRGSGGNPDAPFDGHPAGANPGDFRSIPTQPSKLAHYASYPEKLCLTPLKAGCPRWICRTCGMARVRVTKQEKTGQTQKMPDGWDTDLGGHGSFHRKGRETGETGKPIMESFTIGWSFCSCLCPACGKADCKCGAKWRPGIVLDPFCGIGTTLIVAKKLGLSYLGVDLKPEYVEMAIKRLKNVKYQEEMELSEY